MRLPWILRTKNNIENSKVLSFSSTCSNSNSAMVARLAVTALVLIALATISLQSLASASSVGKFVDETITSHKIVIFSKTYCPYVYTLGSFFYALIWFVFIFMDYGNASWLEFQIRNLFFLGGGDVGSGFVGELSFSVMGFIKMLFFYYLTFFVEEDRISISELMWSCSRVSIAHYVWIVIDNVVFLHFVCANVCVMLAASFCSLFGCMLLGSHLIVF